MEKLKLEVNETSANITEQKDIVSGTVGDTAQVTFSDFWDEYLVRAVWQFERTDPIETVESSNGVYLIPAEIIAKRGYFRIGFYGTNGNDVTPTVWSEKISVLQGVPTGIEYKEPYPTMYDKLAREKQDKLTAGEGINIDGNVISATGGATTPYVEYDPANYQGQRIIPYDNVDIGVSITRWGNVVSIQGLLTATQDVSGWNTGNRDIFVNLPFTPVRAFYTNCLYRAPEYSNSVSMVNIPVKVDIDGSIWLCEGPKDSPIKEGDIFSIDLVYIIKA